MPSNEPSPNLKLPLKILQTLEEIDAPYMVIGAFAGTIFGITRVTYDIDIIVDLQESHIQELADRYPMPRYYADPYQMRNAQQIGSKFNIIDTEEGERADLMALTFASPYKNAFSRRIRQSIVLNEKQSLEIWCARVEDIILGKLMAWQESEARRHETDIFEMLVSQYEGWVTNTIFEEELIDQEVLKIGKKAAVLWKEIKTAAHDSARRLS